MPRTWNNLPGRKLRTNKGWTDLGQVCQYARGLNSTITSWRQWICNQTSGILWPVTHSLRDTVKSGMQRDPTQSWAHSGCWVAVRCCVNPKDASVNTGRRWGGQRGGQKAADRGHSSSGWSRYRLCSPGVSDGGRGWCSGPPIRTRDGWELRLSTGPEDGGESQSLSED